jgi:hypothetical protein
VRSATSTRVAAWMPSRARLRRSWCLFRVGPEETASRCGCLAAGTAEGEGEGLGVASLVEQPTAVPARRRPQRQPGPLDIAGEVDAVETSQRRRESFPSDVPSHADAYDGVGWTAMRRGGTTRQTVAGLCAGDLPGGVQVVPREHRMVFAELAEAVLPCEGPPACLDSSPPPLASPSATIASICSIARGLSAVARPAAATRRGHWA